MDEVEALYAKLLAMEAWARKHPKGMDEGRYGKLSAARREFDVARAEQDTEAAEAGYVYAPHPVHLACMPCPVPAEFAAMRDAKDPLAWTLTDSMRWLSERTKRCIRNGQSCTQYREGLPWNVPLTITEALAILNDEPEKEHANGERNAPCPAEDCGAGTLDFG